MILLHHMYMIFHHCKRVFVNIWVMLIFFPLIKVQVLCDNGLVAEAKRAAERATQHSSSLLLWSKFCQLMCSEDGFEDVCRKALQNIPAKVQDVAIFCEPAVPWMKCALVLQSSLPIWEIWISKSILSDNDTAATERIFQVMHLCSKTVWEL